MFARNGRLGPDRRRKRGQALIEFCFCLPLLLAILLAIIEFGRLYAIWYTLEQAAFEGALLKARDESTSTADVPARAASVANTIAGVNNLAVNVDETDPTFWIVRVSAEVDLVVPKQIGDIKLFNNDAFTFNIEHKAAKTL